MPDDGSGSLPLLRQIITKAISDACRNIEKMPATGRVNREKSDQLPSAEILAAARERMIDWWTRAWIDQDLERRFFLEATYSLPGLDQEQPSLEAIHDAARHQRARLLQDQQIPEWTP